MNENIDLAILKTNSPSCGVNQVYDGNFSDQLKKGEGIFSYLCRKSGILPISSDDEDQINMILTKRK